MKRDELGDGVVMTKFAARIQLVNITHFISHPPTMPDDRLQNARETLESRSNVTVHSLTLTAAALHDLSQLLGTGTLRSSLRSRSSLAARRRRAARWPPPPSCSQPAVVLT